jgi:hypothetical protein
MRRRGLRFATEEEELGEAVDDLRRTSNYKDYVVITLLFLLDAPYAPAAAIANKDDYFLKETFVSLVRGLIAIDPDTIQADDAYVVPGNEADGLSEDDLYGPGWEYLRMLLWHLPCGGRQSHLALALYSGTLCGLSRSLARPVSSRPNRRDHRTGRAGSGRRRTMNPGVLRTLRRPPVARTLVPGSALGHRRATAIRDATARRTTDYPYSPMQSRCRARILTADTAAIACRFFGVFERCHHKLQVQP